MDKLIEQALFKKEELKIKNKTKGRFHFEALTNAGKWMIDKKWIYKANPNVKFMEDERERLEIKLLKKRFQQKSIQNMVMESQYKILVKKPKQLI